MAENFFRKEGILPDKISFTANESLCAQLKENAW